MAKTAEAQTAAMEGSGSYNRNSALQASTMTPALPLFEAAARSIPVGGKAPLVVVDYGASQGRNSMLPMGMALDILHERTNPDREIEVVHTDLPSNDFQSLFTVLDQDKSSYLLGRKNIYPSAIGRSYFGPVLPAGRVDLGWTSNALHWMSRNPVDVPDHGWACFSASKAARDAVDQVLADDWHAFLLARAAELRQGGRLVCQFMGRGTEQHGFEWMAGSFWQSIVELQQEGMITSDELLRMNCPSAGRSVAQVKAPFKDGVFAGLALREVALVENPDPFGDAFRKTGDAEQLGRSWSMAMRAANGPNFVLGLNEGRDRKAFLDAVTERLAMRVAKAPQRSESFIVIAALEKVG